MPRYIASGASCARAFFFSREKGTESLVWMCFDRGLENSRAGRWHFYFYTLLRARNAARDVCVWVYMREWKERERKFGLCGLSCACEREGWKQAGGGALDGIKKMFLVFCECARPALVRCIKHACLFNIRKWRCWNVIVYDDFISEERAVSARLLTLYCFGNARQS